MTTDDQLRAFDLIGVPFDGAATLGWPGSRLAPACIREALDWMMMRNEGGQVYSLDTRGLVPAGGSVITDVGDVSVVPHDLHETLSRTAAAVERSARAGHVPILLGGDDSLLFAGVKGLHDAVGGSIGVIHFDAHLDLMDENARQGRYSHSSGMRRALDLPRVDPGSSIQIGLRHFNYPSSLTFVEAAGPAQITALEFDRMGAAAAAELVLEHVAGADHLYLNFDIDAIDPAHAPGAGAHEPGGLTSRDAIEMVKALAPHLDGFAVTEVNPLRDLHDMTSNLAAYLCYYFAVFGAADARGRAERA